MRAAHRLGLYATVALAAILPGVIRAGGGVPGAPRSDLWNSLWTLWHPLHTGRWTTTQLLGHPDGGVLVCADPVNAALLAPLTLGLGVALAWSVGVFLHLVLAGWSADALARRLGADEAGGVVAGVSFALAPVALCAVHNGTSEAVAAGWLPLALLALHRIQGSRWRVVAATLALAVAGLASPYLALCTWLAAALLLATRAQGRWRGLLALGLATALVLPWYGLVQHLTARPDNLVAIKDALELAQVRRTIGAADPLSFVLFLGYRSPDFSLISRYDEQFVHTTYLGWVWLGAAAVALYRQPRARWPWAALALVGAVLACGPVLVHAGAPVLLPGDLGIPLPWFVVERLPGLSSLSLLYRLAVLPALGVALLASLALRGRQALVLTAAGALEILLLSPMAGGPDAAPLPEAAPLRALADGPEGAVMSWPAVPGRAYIYEATLHQRPVAASLNFPVNRASRAVLGALDDPAQLSRVARQRGVRFLVVHDDDFALPDEHTAAIHALEERATPYAVGEGIRVYTLW